MSTTDNLTISRILTQAAERQVSDIHLSAGNQPVFRRDGKLEILNQEEMLTPELLMEMIQILVPPEKQTILQQQKSITVSFSLGTRARFRVHVDYQKNFPDLDLRYIPMVVPTPEKLGLDKNLISLTDRREGLIIISGPLGSGRTTTLTSLVDKLNHTSAEHILTLEDPIEYLLVNDKSLIKQRDLGDDSPSLVQALDDVKIEDVDVVAVDAPIPASAWPQLLNLASAGILVLVVLEADSTVRALESLTAGSIPNTGDRGFDQLLAEIFIGASCQRLLPRLGGGRILVTELLLGTPAVKSLLREGKAAQLQSILETSRAEGMVSLERGLADLVKTGEIQSDEAVSQAANKDSIKSMLRMR
ncbi:MAG: ATPase, T2SS/T4P/T4SS family [Patescibacteria group bacterium]